jgi:hypothetical protein
MLCRTSVVVWDTCLVVWQRLPQLLGSIAGINSLGNRDARELASDVPMPAFHGDHAHSRMLQSSESVRLLAFIWLVRLPPSEAVLGASTLCACVLPCLWFFCYHIVKIHESKAIHSPNRQIPAINFHYSKRFALKGQGYFFSGQHILTRCIQNYRQSKQETGSGQLHVLQNMSPAENQGP